MMKQRHCSRQRGRSSPTVKSPKAEHVRLEPADGNQALHDLSDKTKFTYRFENEHGKHSSTLQNQVMDSAGDVENLWSNCFLSYVERVPDAKDAYGEIVISLTLENTHGQGRIVTDPKVEANLNTTLDSLFSECISESSFAFDLREENKGLAHVKIYANMQIGDFSKDWEQTMRQSLELCLADLKKRRPQVHAAFKKGEPIDDPKSVECMERTSGFELPTVFDEGPPL